MSELFFHKNPVFTLQGYDRWRKANGYAVGAATQKSLQYFLKKSRITRVKKRLYAVIPMGESVQSPPVDPYLIAGMATEDAVIGFHSALELHGIAYSFYKQFYFMTEKKAKPFSYGDYHFQPVTFSQQLCDKARHHEEVEVINRQGIKLKVTSLERTYVDVLDRIELSGGWEEVIRSLETLAALNIEHLIDYCLQLNRAVLNAKVGYLLEQRQGAFAPSAEQLKRLLSKKPVSTRYATQKKSATFELNKKWNILLPSEVIHKSWEDPNNDV